VAVRKATAGVAQHRRPADLVPLIDADDVVRGWKQRLPGMMDGEADFSGSSF
jgi:hypothetical protein